MSLMLATTNPEAAAAIGTEIDMPQVGWWVMYHYRPGEIIAGQKSAPALVMGRDVGNAVVWLLVVRDVNDMLREDRVPRRRGEERGWEYIQGQASQPAADGTAALIAAAVAKADDVGARLESFMGELSDVFFGEQAKPEIALLDQFAALAERVEKLEAKPARKPRNPSEV